jgi:hypothetical protein
VERVWRRASISGPVSWAKRLGLREPLVEGLRERHPRSPSRNAITALEGALPRFDSKHRLGAMSDTSSFGQCFLDEVKRILGTQPLGYMEQKRIREMDRSEFHTFLRRYAGVTYAELQSLKAVEDPKELAAFFSDSQRRDQLRVLIAATVGMASSG